MLTNYLSQVASPDVQQFLFEHEEEDELALVLQHKELFGLPASVIASQVGGRKKARYKIPSWYHTKGIVYPPSVNLEQASSESTAMFKKRIVENLLSKRNAGIDLTGGLGVDSFFLASLFKTYHYLEPNEELFEVVKHNHKVLRARNIVHHQTTAEDFLEEYSDLFDLVYLDPSRRDEHARKVFKLSECIPDITILQEKIFEISDHILVKTSPLLDIQQGLRELHHVSHVYVVSVENECKELLFLMQKNFVGECAIEAVELKSDGRIISSFRFHTTEESESHVSYEAPREFIYEPNTSIMKAGAFKSVALKYRLKKISVNTHLYTSDAWIENFPGRAFRIELLQVNEKSLDAFLPDKKVNITTRNYPLTPEEIKKKYKLRDGGEKFLIGFSSETKKYLVLASRITKT
jgi:16S rRNA G966 N2-methylase RsmD